MKKIEAERKRLRSQIGKELVELGNLLRTYNVCSDIVPLQSASSECRDRIDDRWGYNFSGLTMHVGAGVKCRPTRVQRFECRLDVAVEGLCPPTIQTDPLLHHKVEIELKAPGAAGKPSFLQAWHFDRHSDEDGIPKLAHPRYHFSFGGKRLENHLDEFGSQHIDGILLLDSPRLAHPPFDGVLAIDFVLSNFAGAQWQTLRALPEYRRIVTNAQERLWLPYVQALHAHWDADAHTKKKWLAAELWPHIH